MKKQSKNKPKVQFPEGCVGIQTLRRSFLLLASKGSHYPNFYDKILRPLLFERKTVVIEDYVQMDTDDERTAHCKKKNKKNKRTWEFIFIVITKQWQQNQKKNI